MAALRKVQFSLKVVMIQERNKVIYAEVDSDFADVLLSFLTLPLGTMVRLLIKHYGKEAPSLGSLNSLYAGLLNLDSRHFWREAGKPMLLNPRNLSANECSRLKLQIVDTPPIQYFTCPKQKCASMFYETTCLCLDSTNTDVTEKVLEIGAGSGDKSVFTAPTSSFILTDDLQILANSPASVVRVLNLNGIEEAGVLEERTLIVGLKESTAANASATSTLDIIKKFFASATYGISVALSRTLADLFLSISSTAATPIVNAIKVFASAGYGSDDLPRSRTSQNKSSNIKKITVKALVQKSTNRVLLAQTRHDFVDFVFSLLTIPLGRVQFLLGNNTCLGSINNLYKSISNSEIFEYMKSRKAIASLLEPQIPSHYLSLDKIFAANQQNSTVLFLLGQP
ncbi:uncharacterized protein [Henckelia pumila]|uniref:uncharacterized protein n=1 Tax=Henckelia pumila TaxID=405737 RepID=UPI003C6E8DA6